MHGGNTDINNSGHFFLGKRVSYSAHSAYQTRHSVTLTTILPGKVMLGIQNQGRGSRESKTFWTSWQRSYLGSQAWPETLADSDDCYLDQVRNCR